MAEASLKYNDVNVGDAAPALSHELTRTDLVMYAGASGDFNPMHHDEVSAQAAGLPSVFGHGMFSMGLLGKAITDYVGIGNLKKYKVRFTKQTWPGETLTSAVVVSGKREEDGEQPRRPRGDAGQPGRRGEGRGRGCRRGGVRTAVQVSLHGGSCEHRGGHAMPAPVRVPPRSSSGGRT